jgi:hypothetical protein
MIHAVREGANPHACAIHTKCSTGHVGTVGRIALAHSHHMGHGFLLWLDRLHLGQPRQSLELIEGHTGADGVILRKAADYFAPKRSDLVQEFSSDLRCDVDQRFAFGIHGNARLQRRHSMQDRFASPYFHLEEQVGIHFLLCRRARSLLVEQRLDLLQSLIAELSLLCSSYAQHKGGP